MTFSKGRDERTFRRRGARTLVDGRTTVDSDEADAGGSPVGAQGKKGDFRTGPHFDQTMEPIVNRVENSDIAVFNLEDLWDERPIVELDLEPFLFEGLIVREMEFRERVKAHDWSQYRGVHVAVHCSADAIIPTWAYMLVASMLDGIARSVALGRQADLVRDHFVRAIEQVDWSRYESLPVVIKGCGSRLVPPSAYVLAMRRLQAVAGKIMYGEPCSAVPLWRRPQTSAGRASSAARAKLPASLPRKG